MSSFGHLFKILGSGDLWISIRSFDPISVPWAHFPREMDLRVGNLGFMITHDPDPEGSGPRENLSPWVFVLPSTCVSQCRGIGGPLLL